MAEIPSFALSVRQPWAWAIIHAGKTLENRSKIAITRGGMDKHSSLAIHASRGMTKDEYESAANFMETLDIVAPRPDELIRGGIIGSVRIADIVKASENPWFFGPWALVIADATPCKPIACRGELGAFRWQVREGDALAEPLQWMRRWPNTLGPTRNAAGDEPWLFGGGSDD